MTWITDIVKDNTNRKIILTGAAFGAAALMGGIGRTLDAKLPGYKRTSDPYYLFTRGAIIGGMVALPAATLLVNRGVNARFLGSVATPPPVHRPLWHDSTVPSYSQPTDSMTFKNAIDGTTYFLPTPAPNN